MSLKPSIAKSQNHINVALPVQSPPRARSAGQSRSPNNTDFDPNPNPALNDEKHSSSLITVLIAVGANPIIAIAKTVAAFLTGSASMIAEAAHSWADAGNGTLLIVAEKSQLNLLTVAIH